MKKFLTCLLSLAMTAALLTACGGNSGAGTSGTETADVDLTAVYNALAEEFHWTEDAANAGPDDMLLMGVETDMLEDFYPGLSALEPVQLVAKMPMMSSIVNEVVFVQCADEEDATAAADILNARIAYQVGDETNPGGAWYPESIAAWEKAEVIQEGTYTALIACGDNQEAVAEAFRANFQ